MGFLATPEGRTIDVVMVPRRTVYRLRISGAAYARLDELAHERECSVPDVIRFAITRYLAAIERQKGDGHV